MVALPDVPLSGVQGTPPPATGIAQTDFGLSQVSADLQHTARIAQTANLLKVRAQADADQKAVAPALVDAQGQLNDTLAKDGAAYTGAPGFVDDQNAKAQAILAAQRQQLAAQPNTTPGMLSEFDKGAQGLALKHTELAYAHQTAVQAAPIAAATKNAQASQVNGGLVDFQGQLAPSLDQLKLGYTGQTDPIAFRDQGLQQFDQTAAAAVAKLPPTLQPELQAQLGAERLRTAADLTDFALKHQQAGVLASANTQAQTALDTVVSSPNAFAGVVAQGGPLDKVIATLPAGLQDDARRDWMAQAVQSRIHGLVQARQGDAAVKELDGGDYDQWLTSAQKETLRGEAEADDRAYGPSAVTDGVQKAQAEQRLQANLISLRTTGRPSLQPGELDADAKLLGGEAIGRYYVQQQQAMQSVAATGPVASMSNADLAHAAATPAPDPADPAYADKLPMWQAQQQAIAAEAKARANPGAWVFGNGQHFADGSQVGTAMQGKWQAATTAQTPQARTAAMADYTGTMLQVQMQAGIDAAHRQIVPQPIAAALAAEVVKAPPEGRLAAMQQAAGLISSLPADLKLSDGSIAHPRAMLAGQLAAAGLTPIESSAIADFGTNPAALGRVVAALNDASASAKGPAGSLVDRVRGDPLPGLVKADVGPYLNSDPSDVTLNAGRLQRTLLVARELQKQGLAPGDAAARAAQDLTGAYSFNQGWRMPAALANATVMGPPGVQLVGGMPVWAPAGISGEKAASLGAAKVLAQLSANNGAGLYAPASIGGPPSQRQAIYASQIAKSGRWLTLPDDSGLGLAIPKPDGQWQQVTDKFGRPVRASWGQLQGVNAGQASPFAAAPPAALKAADGAPVRAVSKSEGFAALSASVQYQETRNNPAQISRTGALGAMQLEPGTGAKYAAQLGLPWDPDRALHDVGYNRQIGNAALTDLINRYGTGPGLGLALAAYNAGEGRLTGFHDRAGWHAGWLSTLGDPRAGAISLTDWVQKIPIAETRNYVSEVLQRAVAHLHEAG